MNTVAHEDFQGFKPNINIDDSTNNFIHFFLALEQKAKGPY